KYRLDNNELSCSDYQSQYLPEPYEAQATGWRDQRYHRNCQCVQLNRWLLHNFYRWDQWTPGPYDLGWPLNRRWERISLSRVLFVQLFYQRDSLPSKLWQRNNQPGSVLCYRYQWRPVLTYIMDRAYVESEPASNRHNPDRSKLRRMRSLRVGLHLRT